MVTPVAKVATLVGLVGVGPMLGALAPVARSRPLVHTAPASRVVTLAPAGETPLPAVGVNARGDAVVVWRSMGLGSAFKPAGGRWGTAESLVAGEAESLAALDARGDAMTLASGESAFKPADRPWLPLEDLPGLGAVNVLPPYNSYAYDADLALNGPGNAVAAWVTGAPPEVREQPPELVQTASRPAGGAWQGLMAFSVRGGFEGTRVALDGRGDAVVAWVRWLAGGQIVESTYKPAGGTWEAPTDVSVEPGETNVPRVALDARGDAIVAWERGAGSNHFVQSAFRPSGGRWQAPENVSVPNPGVPSPELAMNARGEAVVVWNSGNLTYCVVRAAFRRPGKRWGRCAQLSKTNLFPTKPRVGIDARGDAFVAWLGTSGRRYYNTVQAAVKLGAGPWQAPRALSKPGPVAREPDVALSERGYAVAAWTLERGTSTIVQAMSMSLPRSRPKHSRKATS